MNAQQATQRPRSKTGAPPPPAEHQPDTVATALTPPLCAADQRRVVSGLQVGIFVAAIDSTLVSVALLSSARDLGGASLIAWIVAGYTVAATVATPVYGSLGVGWHKLHDRLP